MTREDRKDIIDNNLHNISHVERTNVYAINALIGDDDELDIDWDDLIEVTGLQPQEIEELLDVMYTLGILTILNYEDGVYG